MNKNRFLSDAPTSDDNLGTCQKVAKSLLRFVVHNEGINAPFIIGLFGAWGSGKSSALKLLANEAEESKDVIIVQIDAWKKSKESFLRDFLKAIIVKFKKEDLLSAKESEKFVRKVSVKEINQETDWKLKDKAKTRLVFMAVVLMLIPSLWLVSYFLEWKGLIDAVSIPPVWMFQFALAGIVTYLIHLVLTEGKVQNTSSTEAMDISDPSKFRHIFSALLGNPKIKGRSLCILIDNLDRCDADEAIEIMRRIKTFMVSDDDTNVTFIVACDEVALERHLRTVFKQEKNEAKEFLRKFFNITLKLPSIHHSDMNDFIHNQLNEVFDKNSILNLTKEEKKNVRNVIYASYSTTPRQVKQFINQFAAKLYVLKAAEEASILKKVKPTKRPEIVALYLAVCDCTSGNGFYAYDSIQSPPASGIPPKPNRVVSNLNKLNSLNLHLNLDRSLWAAIEQMKDPNNRSRWSGFSDMYHALEIKSSADFKKLLSDTPAEYHHEVIEDLFAECKERGNTDAKETLIKFILKEDIFEQVTPCQQLASILTTSAKADNQWQGWNGKGLAYYVKDYASLVDSILDKLSRGNFNEMSLNASREFLLSTVSVAKGSILSHLWTWTSSIPDILEVMLKRPETIKQENFNYLLDLYLPEMMLHSPQEETNLASRLERIIELMKERKLTENVKNELFILLLERNFSILLANPRKVEDFFNAGGAKFVQTLINKIEDIEAPDLTNLSELTTLLIQHIAQVQDPLIKLLILDLIGLILDVEDKIDVEMIRPDIKANLQNVLWNEVSQLEAPSLLSLFDNHSVLLTIIPQPNKPVLAIRDTNLYDFLMRNDAIPNNWYSSLIEQSVAGVNIFGQWLDEYWKNLSLDEKKVLHEYVSSRWQQLGIALLLRMDANDEPELLAQRYELLATQYNLLISGQNINSPVGFETLLLEIERLTAFKGSIPEALFSLVDNARRSIPHDDLSKKAQGLKIKWGKAVKRGQSL